MCELQTVFLIFDIFVAGYRRQIQHTP